MWAVSSHCLGCYHPPCSEGRLSLSTSEVYAVVRAPTPPDQSWSSRSSTAGGWTTHYHFHQEQGKHSALSWLPAHEQPVRGRHILSSQPAVCNTSVKPAHKVWCNYKGPTQSSAEKSATASTFTVPLAVTKLSHDDVICSALLHENYSMKLPL